MRWERNKIIDDKNKFLVAFMDDDEWHGYVNITVLDNNGNNITYNDLSDWEFSEFPKLNSQNESAEDEIKIVNNKLGVTGKIMLESLNNGYCSSKYWTEKNRIL